MGNLPLPATRISEREFAVFMRRCQNDPRSNIMFAPKVTFFNGQSAVISDVVQRPFVTDVSVVNSELQPEISVYENGWTAEATGY